MAGAIAFADADESNGVVDTYQSRGGFLDTGELLALVQAVRLDGIKVDFGKMQAVPGRVGEVVPGLLRRSFRSGFPA